MLRQTARGAALLLTLACGGAPHGEHRATASPPAGPPARPPVGPDSVPCVPGDRMPRLPLDTSRAYTLRIVPPDTSRRYAMREYRFRICPPDAAPSPELRRK
jgi:hypothetical protein